MERLAHQMANQITVINLTCFKLCTILKNAGAAVNADIERLEKAVSEMNVLVEILSHLEEQAAAPSIAASPNAVIANTMPANVYPLFETKKNNA